MAWTWGCKGFLGNKKDYPITSREVKRDKALGVETGVQKSRGLGQDLESS